ncbi:MAG: CopG family transcriptional regulator [Chloroflexi bacterium]|nr:CopG family transcriptional regulator [Chloroflexota bacterium]
MMQTVRTTITLDEDVAALLARVRGEQSLGLKKAVNLGLRQGLPLIGKRAVGRPFRTRAIDTGRYLVDVDDVAAALAIGEGEGRR